MSGRVAVHITQNFARNLEAIQAYLEGRPPAGAFNALLDQLFGTIIPNIEEFPEIGFDFLARKPRSYEGAAQVRGLQRRLGEGASIREYIVGDYLVLYARREADAHLLAIKHHLQLSFDLRAHWDR